MVPHTAAHGGTSMNAVSKQLTLSQVAPLPHCRLCLATASQQHNLHHPHLHHACSPHLLHLQHQQLRWNRLQLFLPCQLFQKNVPGTKVCDIPCHTCAAMKIWPCLHGTKMPDPRDLGTVDPDCPWTLFLSCATTYIPSKLLYLNHCVFYSQNGGCCMITFSFKDQSLNQLISSLCSSHCFPASHWPCCLRV